MLSSLLFLLSLSLCHSAQNDKWLFLAWCMHSSLLWLWSYSLWHSIQNGFTSGTGVVLGLLATCSRPVLVGTSRMLISTDFPYGTMQCTEPELFFASVLVHVQLTAVSPNPQSFPQCTKWHFIWQLGGFELWDHSVPTPPLGICHSVSAHGQTKQIRKMGSSLPWLTSRCQVNSPSHLVAGQVLITDNCLWCFSMSVGL